MKNTYEEYLWRILLLQHILFFSTDFQESTMVFFCDSSINKLSFLFLSDVFLSVYSISIVRFPPRIWAWIDDFVGLAMHQVYHPYLTQVDLDYHVAMLAWIFICLTTTSTVLYDKPNCSVCLFNISAFFDLTNF